MSDDELDKEAEEFCKRFFADRKKSERIITILTVKRSHPNPLLWPWPLYHDHQLFVYQSWFFKTFEQDTFDYNLCLN